MKTFLEFMREDFSPDMQNFLKNNEMNRKMKAREPAEPSKFAPLDPNWQEKMNNKFNAIINSKPVDFSGSRYGDEGIVSDQDKITRQNQNRLRRDYQQPPGYDTPAFDKAKERMAAADARDGEPPMPGAGPYKFKRADPLKTPQSVPIGPTSSTNIQKPKAKPAEIDQRVPRPKARPEVQGPNNQDRKPQEVKGLQPGNPDTSLDVLKGFRYDPEKEPKKIQDRLPQKSNVSTSGMGTFAISKGDPNSLRYQKAADVSKYIPRTRTKPEVASTSKSVTIGSDKGTGTLWDIAKKRVGKGGDINKEIQRIRSLNNNIDPRKLKKGQKITVDEDARLDTIRDVNIKNRIAGVKRVKKSVDFDAGDPSKLNFPKNSVGQVVEPVKPKMKSVPSGTGVKRSDTPVGTMPKAKPPSIPSGTGVKRSDTPVGTLALAKVPSIPSGTGIGRSNTPVGSLPKAKPPSISSNTGVKRSDTPVGTLPKAKVPSVPSGTGVKRSDTPVGSLPKAKPPSVPSGTGIGRSNTPVGSLPKAKPPSIPSGTGIGRSNTPVGSMPKAKVKNYNNMKDAWGTIDRFPGEGGSDLPWLEKGDKADSNHKTIRYYQGKREIEDRTKPKDWEAIDRFPGEGGSELPSLKKGDRASPEDKATRYREGKREIEDRTKYLEKSVPRYFDSPEKLKKDAEQTWKIKAREPKSSPIEKQYSGGFSSVEDKIDISSPKETLKSYINRRKKDTDNYYLPNKDKKGKIKDFDMISALGYSGAKDVKTGLPDIKQERDPALWGSYAPWSGRLQVRKEPFRGKSTTTHEYGHRGSTMYKEKLPKGPEKLSYNDTYDTEEMRQREMDARKSPDSGSNKDAKSWWKSLYKGENPRDRLSMFGPVSSRDTPHDKYDGRTVAPKGFTYPRSEKQVKKDQVFKGLGDRDRISIERKNDRIIDYARGELSKKYFKGGRESHTDDDLKSSALSSTLPYANKNLGNKNTNSNAGDPKTLNFPKTNPTLRKMDVDTRQKQVKKIGHLATVFDVQKRNSDNNITGRFPDNETGNPNQLNFPRKKQY